MLVWPIYHSNLLHTHHSNPSYTLHSNHLHLNTSPLRWSFGGNKCTLYSYALHMISPRVLTLKLKQHYFKAFADFSIRIFRNLSCRNIVIRTFVTQKWSDLKINLWTCKPSNLLFTLGEASEHLKGRTVPPVSYFFLDQPKDFVIFLFLANI